MNTDFYTYTFVFWPYNCIDTHTYFQKSIVFCIWTTDLNGEIMWLEVHCLGPWPYHTWHIWEVAEADGPPQNNFPELICMQKIEGQLGSKRPVCPSRYWPFHKYMDSCLSPANRRAVAQNVRPSSTPLMLWWWSEMVSLRAGLLPSLRRAVLMAWWPALPSMNGVNHGRARHLYEAPLLKEMDMYWLDWM